MSETIVVCRVLRLRRESILGFGSRFRAGCIRWGFAARAVLRDRFCLCLELGMILLEDKGILALPLVRLVGRRMRLDGLRGKFCKRSWSFYLKSVGVICGMNLLR